MYPDDGSAAVNAPIYGDAGFGALAPVTLAEATPTEPAGVVAAPVLAESPPVGTPPRNGGRYSYNPVTDTYTEI